MARESLYHRALRAYQKSSGTDLNLNQLRSDSGFKTHYADQRRERKLQQRDYNFSQDNRRERYEYYLRRYAISHKQTYKQAQQDPNFQRVYKEAQQIREAKGNLTEEQAKRMRDIYHEVGFQKDANIYVQQLQRG